jgi:hypothetical protein
MADSWLFFFDAAKKAAEIPAKRGVIAVRRRAWLLWYLEASVGVLPPVG